jgi:predicted Zn-dependent protease
MKHRRRSRLIGLWAVLMWALSGCAAPVDRFDPRFVARPELLAVSDTRAGLELLGQRRFTEAEARFRRALALYPGAGNVRRNLGAALLGGGQFEEAEGVFRDLIAREGDSVAVRLSLGEALMGQDRRGDADVEYGRAAALARALSDGRGESVAALARAEIAFQRGAEDEAVCFARAAYRARADSETSGRLARFLLATNKPGEVPAVVDPLIASTPPDPRLLAVRGLAAFALGERSVAQSYANRGLAAVGPGGGGLRAELRELAQTSGGAPPSTLEGGAVPESRFLALPPEFLRSLCLRGGCAPVSELTAKTGRLRAALELPD